MWEYIQSNEGINGEYPQCGLQLLSDSTVASDTDSLQETNRYYICI